MPIATQPDLKFAVVLDIDKHLPPETQPKFFYRHQSSRKQRQLLREYEAMDNLRDADAALDVVFRLILTLLCGWEHITDPESGGEMPYSAATAAERIEDILTLPEANELLVKMISQQPEADELKKSGSPSPSVTAASANPAAV
jgi:hypothetical protein